MGPWSRRAYNLQRMSRLMEPTDMEGVLQQLNPPAEAKFPHRVRLVDLNCLTAQVQPRGDFFVAVARNSSSRKVWSA